MIDDTRRRIAARTRHAVAYRDGTWWCCTPDGIVGPAQSRRSLDAADCRAMMHSGELSAVRTLSPSATLYQLEGAP